MLAQIISRTLSKMAMETMKCILLKQMKPEKFVWPNKIRLEDWEKFIVSMLNSLLSLGIFYQVRVLQSFTCVIYLCSKDHTNLSIPFNKQVVAIAQFPAISIPTFPRMLQNIL